MAAIGSLRRPFWSDSPARASRIAERAASRLAPSAISLSATDCATPWRAQSVVIWEIRLRSWLRISSALTGAAPRCSGAVGGVVARCSCATEPTPAPAPQRRRNTATASVRSSACSCSTRPDRTHSRTERHDVAPCRPEDPGQGAAGVARPRPRYRQPGRDLERPRHLRWGAGTRHGGELAGRDGIRIIAIPSWGHSSAGRARRSQ